MPFLQRSSRPPLPRSHSSILKSPKKKLVRTGQWLKDLVNKKDNGFGGGFSDDGRGSSSSYSSRSTSPDVLETLAEQMAATDRLIARIAKEQNITIPQPIPGYVPIGYATRKEYLESGERDSILDNPVGHNWYDEFEADDIRLKNDPRFPGMIFEHPDLDSHYDSLGIKASSYDHEVASSTQAPAKIEHAHQIQTEYLHHTQVEELRLVQNKHVSHVYPEQVHHAQKRHVSHIPTIHHIQNEHVSHIPTGHVPHIQNKTVTPSHAEKTPHIPTKSFSIISYDADLSDTSDESEDEDAMEARLQEMKFAQIEACRAETAARQQRKAERQLEEKLLAITAASRCSSLGLISGDGYESDDASQQSFLSHDRLSDIASQTSFTASVVNTNFDKPSHQLTSGLDKNDDNVAITTEPESIFIQEYDGTTVATFSDCQPTQFDENSVTAVEHLSPHQSIVADQIDDYATEPVDPVCYLPDLAFDIPKDSVRSNPGTADLEDSILDLQYQIVKKRKAAIRVLKKRVAKEASDNNGFESYFADVKESAPEPKLVTLWNLKTDSSFKNGAGTSTGPSIFGPAIVKDDTTEDAVLPEAADDPTKDITHDQVTATYQDGANSDLPDDAFDVADAVFNNIPVADDSHRMTYGLTDLAYNPAAAKIVASSDNKRDNLWLGNAVYEPTKYQNYVKVGSSHGFGGSQLSPYGFQSTASDHADDFAQFFGSGSSSPTNAATTSLDIRDILGIKHESKEAPEIGSHFASANSLVPASAPVPGPVPAPVPGPVPASLSSAPTITTSAASEKPVRLENHIVKMIDVKGFPGQFKGRMTAAQYTRRNLLNTSKVCKYMGIPEHLNNIILHKDLHACPALGAEYSPEYLNDNPEVETCLAYGYEMTQAAANTARTPAEEAFRVTVHRELAAARLDGECIGEYRYLNGFLTVEEYHERRMCICFGMCDCSKMCSQFGDMICPCHDKVETCCR